jgi:hypothetical protein
MGQRRDAWFRHERIIAEAAHALAVCCIPVFSLVLLIGNSTPASEHHGPIPPEQV